MTTTTPVLNVLDAATIPDRWSVSIYEINNRLIANPAPTFHDIILAQLDDIEGDNLCDYATNMGVNLMIATGVHTTVKLDEACNDIVDVVSLIVSKVGIHMWAAEDVSTLDDTATIAMVSAAAELLAETHAEAAAAVRAGLALL